MHPILYIHDLDGTPTDAMAQLLRKANPNVTTPDGRFKTLAARTSEAMTALGTYPTTVVVGFGFGALAALALAVANPKRVSVLVLLSPALQWSEPPLFDADTISLPPNLRVVMFHGTEDAVTPISVARTFAERFPDPSARSASSGSRTRRSCRQATSARQWCLPTISTGARSTRRLPCCTGGNRWLRMGSASRWRAGSPISRQPSGSRAAPSSVARAKAQPPRCWSRPASPSG
jgi:Phospholipase/Carboxylesterase